MPDKTTTDRWREEARDFSQRYDYDNSYMEDLLERSPEAYQAFLGGMGMSGVQQATPPELAAVARMAALRVEDCGSCLELSIKMAREAGVSEAVIRGALRGGEGLEGDTRDVHHFARAVAANEPLDEAWRSALEKRLGKEVVAELAVMIAGVRIYPAVKRALGYAKSCSLIPELAG